MSIANVNLKQLKLDTRQLKAFEMVSEDSAITKIRKGNYLVKSQTSDKYYQVKEQRSGWTCDCLDYSNRKALCKHIYAVQLKERQTKLD